MQAVTYPRGSYFLQEGQGRYTMGWMKRSIRYRSLATALHVQILEYMRVSCLMQYLFIEMHRPCIMLLQSFVKPFDRLNRIMSILSDIKRRGNGLIQSGIVPHLMHCFALAKA